MSKNARKLYLAIVCFFVVVCISRHKCTYFVSISTFKALTSSLPSRPLLVFLVLIPALKFPASRKTSLERHSIVTHLQDEVIGKLRSRYSDIESTYNQVKCANINEFG